jgi:putative Holliday junction resolvase
MRYLGIDYGIKRVGLAISDEEGMMAFPYKIVQNNQELLDTIHNICGQEEIGGIVIGESQNLSGEPNKIMAEVSEFKDKLTSEVKLPIFFEKEFMTSLHSGEQKSKNIFSDRKTKKEIKNKNDSQAAALILQRFLDREKQS